MKERICETCPRPIRANNLAICRNCEAELKRRLGNQASHRHDLEIEYLRQTRKAEVLRRGGFEFPILFEAQARKLLERQLQLLKSWLWQLIEIDAKRKHPTLIAPRSCTVPVLGGWLIGHLSVLRRKAEAGKMLRDIRSLDADVFTLIDLPATRTKVHVGPCPNTWPVDDDQTRREHCPGQVDAYVPADETAPAYMRCDACAAEWPSRYWSDIGADIIARAEELNRQRDLARMVAKGVA